MILLNIGSIISKDNLVNDFITGHETETWQLNTDLFELNLITLPGKIILTTLSLPDQSSFELIVFQLLIVYILKIFLSAMCTNGILKELFIIYVDNVTNLEGILMPC